jgi:hypothetical protein
MVDKKAILGCVAIVLLFFGAASMVNKWLMSRPVRPTGQDQATSSIQPENETERTAGPSREEAAPNPQPADEQTAGKRQLYPLDPRTKAALVGGPSITAYIGLPSGAAFHSVSVSLEGGVEIDNLTYLVPLKARKAKVCYRDPVLETCRQIELQSGENRLPLTELHISSPEYFTLWCHLSGGEYEITRDIRIGSLFSIDNNSDKRGTFLMPGEYLLACDVRGGSHADHLHGAVASYTASGVSVNIEASPSGGDVYAVYDVNGDEVRAVASTNPVSRSY